MLFYCQIEGTGVKITVEDEGVNTVLTNHVTSIPNHI